MSIRKVLLVDDDPDIRIIGSMSLRNVGKWQVVVAEDGAAAVEAVERERPDLVLLDVVMPGLDGPATLRRIRELPAGATLTVLFLTAKSQETERTRLLALGAQGVLAKPFSPMLLPRQICLILEQVR